MPVDFPLPLPCSPAARALLCGLLLMACGRPAQAQWSASLDWLSDYRFRGVSLSNAHPVVQADLVYDCADGGFAGAMLSPVHLAYAPANAWQSLFYGGYAKHWRAQGSWEIGASYARFSRPLADSYGEVFAGLSWAGFSTRLYYAPRYFGQSSHSLYWESSVQQALGSASYVVLGLGALKQGGSSHWVEDYRLGLGTHRFGLDWQLAYLGRMQQTYAYPPVEQQPRQTWQLSLSRAF